MIVTIEQDEKYFRVIVRFETHKLHSEKLNIETAFDLAYNIKRDILLNDG